MSRSVIVSFARTPIAKFRGSLASVPAPALGAVAIKGAVARTQIENLDVVEAFMGNVVSAGIGQAPCRQAVLGANLSPSTICTTINKVCASGMKSVMLASQMIQCNMLQKSNQGIVAGGMESMSNIPHYLKQFRQGSALGHSEILDGVIHDGLWDVYNDQHMGMCAEKCATDYDIGREEQDAYAVMSYQRAQGAIAAGIFKDEIEAVDVSHGKGKTSTISEDEEPTSASMGKFARLRPAFKKENGTVTAANASSLNDGAAAMVLMSEDAALELGLKPLARILGFGDAEQDPVDFTTAPSLAVPRALAASGVQLSDIEFHEINEAFSVVALANMKILDLDQARVNVFGGAVALGHPIGMSGARIIGNLYNVLKTKNASLGCASICNGGGGASAIVIERTQ